MVVWLEAVVAAVMGAAVLSFVQLAVDRAGGSVGLLGRSRCPRCATELRAWKVLPIAGFLLLRGRCRSCGAAIPRRHLVGEVAVGVYWAATVVLLGPVVWLPVVLVAPLVVMLLRSPVRAAGRTPLAGLLHRWGGIADVGFRRVVRGPLSAHRCPAAELALAVD